MTATLSMPPPETVWLYWEGVVPPYVSLCIKGIQAHNDNVVILDRSSFDNLFERDRDIDIDSLKLNHQSDFVRAYLLKHFGGLYLDADCIVLKSLAPVIEMCKHAGFVGYREPQGYMSCNFMASVPDGSVITHHYELVCSKLRAGCDLKWLDLASIPMDIAVGGHSGQMITLPTRAVMPLPWSESHRLCIRRSDWEHEERFNPDALCYMLANNTIKTRGETKLLYYMPESALLRDSSFAAFLFRKSLGYKPRSMFGTESRACKDNKLAPFDEGAMDYLTSRFHVKSLIDTACGLGGMVFYALSKGIKAVGVESDASIAHDCPFIIEHDYAEKPLYAGEFDLGWVPDINRRVDQAFNSNRMETLRGCRNLFVMVDRKEASEPGAAQDLWVDNLNAAGFDLDKESSRGVDEHSSARGPFRERMNLVFSRRQSVI